MTPAAIVTDGLAKRYGSRWALQDCSLSVPQGSVTALVGPNGAGKSTLLHLAVGLLKPTAGTISTLGLDPAAQATELLPRVGFVGQEHPLHLGFTVGDTLKLGAKLNPTWDASRADERIDRLGLSLDQKVGQLSGGERAQVALTLALAKRPALLLLDEPVAALDPLARREFLATVMEAVSEDGMTVLLSSHIVADLERVCDHLVILSASRTQLSGPIDEILAAHRVLTGVPTDGRSDARHYDVVAETQTERQATRLVRSAAHVYDANWEVHDVDLEEIVLAYLARGYVAPRPASVREAVAQ